MTAGRASAAALLTLALTSLPRAAIAQPAADVVADPKVSIDVDPALGTTLRGGQGELVAHVMNHHEGPIDGELLVLHVDYPAPTLEASAPYHLEPGASAVVHLPVGEASTFFEAKNAKGGLIFQKEIAGGGAANAVIADLAAASRVAGALARVAINPEYRPPSYYGGYGGTDPLIDVVTPRPSPETGDLMLPSYLAGFQGVHLVVIRSDDLAKLSGAELEALSGFALAGGTIAVVRRHGADLRAPTLTAWVGGTAIETPPPAAELETIVPAPLQPPNVQKWPSTPVVPLAGTELAGFTGGNLRPSPFGASAPYGLGQIVLLGFDVDNPATMEDPWVQVRLTELVRQAYDRRSIVAADPWAVPRAPSYFRWNEGIYHDVRRLLDPNESARWGIAVGAVLLVAYAVLAGPVLFTRAAKRKRPLLALALLPLLSLAAFAAIVALGFVARGTSSRARRLTFVDVGAGMKRGISRRFRGYYSASSSRLDVVPATRTAGLTIGGSTSDAAASVSGVLAVDRDGAYLSGISIAPWQTLVVREDGLASIGNGVSISPEAGSREVLVRNGTGRALRAVIVKLSDDQYRFVRSIRAGESIDTRGSGALPRALRDWLTGVQTTRNFGRLPVHGLNAPMLVDALAPDGDVGAAWVAASAFTSESTDWFPSGVPVLLGALEGSDGPSSDAGMKLDWDRTLVRVVGYGGEP